MDWPWLLVTVTATGVVSSARHCGAVQVWRLEVPVSTCVPRVPALASQENVSGFPWGSVARMPTSAVPPGGRTAEDCEKPLSRGSTWPGWVPPGGIAWAARGEAMTSRNPPATKARRRRR
ncbi:hypothetical protein D7V77_21500 [Corallococcus sp. CA041A]|nr:hypothetical protein D7V77_21500 [Corallococcus sp. CA041A]